MTTVQYVPGLENVIAAESRISAIDVEAHSIVVMGYDLSEVSLKASYEEVAHLLLFGHLPNELELRNFSRQLEDNRSLPREVYDWLRLMPSSIKPMDQLRIAIPMLAVFDPEVEDNSHEANIRKATRLIAKLPILIAHGYRIARGRELVSPDPSLPHAQNFLYMITGKKANDFEGKVFETSMNLYVEHELAASTFAARVVASTFCDIYGAAAAAVSALKGPLHGRANEKAMEMLLQIGQVDNSERWIRASLERSERIMGFGHRVYRRGLDPRADIMKGFLKDLGERIGQTKWYEMTVRIEELMRNERNLYPNVDYYVGPVYYLLGIPIELDTAVFAAARMAGWAAHAIEQHGNNRIFRPRALYTGLRGLRYTPLEQRS